MSSLETSHATQSIADMRIRVYYEDTDLGGVVYHSNYLNFCERARSELFFKNGDSPVLKEGHFVARSIQAEYLRPARFADLLHVKSALVGFQGASFTMLQEIFKADEKLFSMTIKLVFLSHEGKPIRIPESLKHELERYLETAH